MILKRSWDEFTTLQQPVSAHCRVLRYGLSQAASILLEGDALYGYSPVMAALQAGRRSLKRLYLQHGASSPYSLNPIIL